MEHQHENVHLYEEPEKFPLVTKKGWVMLNGHRLKVGEFSFSAVPIGDKIRVSELITGAKIKDFAIDYGEDTFENMMIHLGSVISMNLIMIIDKIGKEKFRKNIDEFKSKNKELFKKKPQIQKHDVELSSIENYTILH